MIGDDSVAQFVSVKFQELEGLTIEMGRHLDAAAALAERIVQTEMELKLALRDGVFQRQLQL